MYYMVTRTLPKDSRVDMFLNVNICLHTLCSCSAGLPLYFGNMLMLLLLFPCMDF